VHRQEGHPSRRNRRMLVRFVRQRCRRVGPLHLRLRLAAPQGLHRSSPGPRRLGCLGRHPSARQYRPWLFQRRQQHRQFPRQRSMLLRSRQLVRRQEDHPGHQCRHIFEKLVRCRHRHAVLLPIHRCLAAVRGLHRGSYGLKGLGPRPSARRCRPCLPLVSIRWPCSRAWRQQQRSQHRQQPRRSMLLRDHRLACHQEDHPGHLCRCMLVKLMRHLHHQRGCWQCRQMSAAPVLHHRKATCQGPQWPRSHQPDTPCSPRLSARATECSHLLQARCIRHPRVDHH